MARFSRLNAEVVWLLVILAVGAGLRFFRISFQSLWFDEIMTLYWATAPWPDFAEWLIQGPEPPLYYLVMRAWAHVGTSELALRFPSAVFGVVGIALIWWLVRALGLPRLALPAAAVLAVAPFHIEYSQEARSYAIWFALVAFSMAAFLNALSTGRRGMWAAYALATGVSFYVHYFTAFALASQAIIVGWAHLTRRVSRSRALAWLLAAALAVALVLPWEVGRASLGRVPAFEGQAGYRTSSPLLIGGTLFMMSVGRAIDPRDILQQTRLILTHALPAALVFGGLSAAGLWALRRERFALVFLLVHFLLPVLGAWIINFRIRFYVPRYMMVAFPAYVIMLAAGLVHLRRLPRAAAAAALLAVIAFFLMPRYTQPDVKEPWRLIAALVQRNSRPGDVIAFHKTYMRLPFDYYYRGSLRRVALPNEIVRSPDEQRRVLDRFRGARRVWLVLGHNYDTGDFYPDLFRSRMRLRRAYAFHRGTIHVELFLPLRHSPLRSGSASPRLAACGQ